MNNKPLFFYGWSRASTGGIFSVNLIVYGIAAPFAGALVDRFGPKRFFLTGGNISASLSDRIGREKTFSLGCFLLTLGFGLGGTVGP